MPLALDDGYTLPFVTPTELVSLTTGRAIEGGLIPVSGRYRPATFAEIQEYEYSISRVSSGGEAARIVATFIAKHVIDWDITYKGGTLKPTADNILNVVPDTYVTLILREVLKWAPKEQESVAGNS